MVWTDRINEAAYNSPSGIRLTFDFEDLSKSFDINGTAFNFPDADGTYVQQTSNTGRRFPIRAIFWGDVHDLEAAAFEAALSERGIGKLEHPFYGEFKVVPFGTITQRDDLKTAANQSILELTFFQTIDLIYPSSQIEPSSAIISAVDDFNDSLGAEYEKDVDVNTAVYKSSLKNTSVSLIDKVKSALKVVSDTQAEVKKEFNNIYDSINNGIDVLVGEPLNLAYQTALLIQSPARALTDIQAKLSAYSNLASSILSTGTASTVNTNDKRDENAFHSNDLVAKTVVTGSALAALNNEFSTKPDAIAAAETILNQFDDVVTWRDENLEMYNIIDEGSAYQKLQTVVALIAGYLVEISFSLKQERKFKLDRNRTVLDLAAELYGNIDDDTLNFFITSNNLTGSEILELSVGREIVYYI